MSGGSDLTFDGLTIQNATTGAGMNPPLGQGITCTGATLTIRHLTVAGNTSTGIDTNSCKLTIVSGSVISGNGAAGVFAHNASNVTIDASTIRDNPSGGITFAHSNFTLTKELI